MVTALSLTFQKKDHDVSVVDISIGSCLSDLQKSLREPSETSYLNLLDQELVKTGGKHYYKGSLITALPNHIKHFENIKKDFIDTH